MKVTIDKLTAAAISLIRKRVYVCANSMRKNAIHLFLLSPPLSGSTVVKQLISTSPFVTSFRTEGQWLPEARKILGVPDRWDVNLPIDWKRVKKIFYSYWSPMKPIRFEKSPPHTIRAKQLEQAFERSYFLVSIRNPYAMIEGGLRRKWMTSASAGAQLWIKTAEAQRYNMSNLKKVLFFRYEELVERPEEIRKKILEFLPELDNLALHSQFTAHNITGKPLHGLKNLNQIKIEKLSTSHIKEINEVLKKRMDLLDHFGYSLI